MDDKQLAAIEADAKEFVAGKTRKRMNRERFRVHRNGNGGYMAVADGTASFLRFDASVTVACTADTKHIVVKPGGKNIVCRNGGSIKNPGLVIYNTPLAMHLNLKVGDSVSYKVVHASAEKVIGEREE